MNLNLSESQLPFRIRLEAPMSEDDLLHFCSLNDPLRIEREANGDLLVMTPAGSKSSNINMRICRLLDEWAEIDGRGIAFDSNGGFTLQDGSMRSADAAWVSYTRWNALTERQQAGFAPLCPEFVIELRSATDRLQDQERKMDQWMENGAKLGWLVDPQRKVVAIYHPGDEPEVYFEPSSVQGEGPVAGFEILLSRLWA